MNHETLRDALRRVAASPVCHEFFDAPRIGTAVPVGNTTVILRSNSFAVIDAAGFDALAEIAAALAKETGPGERAALETLRAGLLGHGFGPVAPCFDEDGCNAEWGRGRWYVTDGLLFRAFQARVQAL